MNIDESEKLIDRVLGRIFAEPTPTGEWTTTADKDGDCAIVIGTTLIGVGCTVQQTLNIVNAHNAALAAAYKRGYESTVGWKIAEDRWKEIEDLEQQLAAAAALAKGNITGCGTCATILAKIEKECA